MQIKKLVILVPLFLLIIFLRIMFSFSDELVYLIGAVNLISLIIVIACILDKTICKLKEKLKKFPQQLSEQTIKTATKKITFISIILLVIFGVFFFWKFNCSLGNDILTIFTIGLSLLDEEIANIISDKY